MAEKEEETNISTSIKKQKRKNKNKNNLLENPVPKPGHKNADEEHSGEANKTKDNLAKKNKKKKTKTKPNEVEMSLKENPLFQNEAGSGIQTSRDNTENKGNEKESPHENGSNNNVQKLSEETAEKQNTGGDQTAKSDDGNQTARSDDGNQMAKTDDGNQTARTDDGDETETPDNKEDNDQEFDLNEVPTERIVLNDDTILVDRLRCVQCKQALCYPLRFVECGHRICSTCFHDNRNGDEETTCLICGDVIDVSKIILDRKIQRKVLKTKVNCMGKEFGCDWAGAIKNLTMHQPTCEKVGVFCTNDCGVKIERRNLSDHLSNECIERMVICDYCKKQVQEKDKKYHYEKCPKFELPCPNNCIKDLLIPRDEIDTHLEEECPKTRVFCPFQNIGCQEKVRRAKLARHLKFGIIGHVRLLYDVLMTQDEVIKQHHKLLCDHGALLENHEEQITEFYASTKGYLIWKIEDVSRKYAEAKAGTTEILYSSPFSTSKYGYRLRATICLYGDGKAKGSHVSVFVHILKGKFDEILCWPFEHKITFHLLHQDENRNLRKHIRFIINPNGTPENEAFLGRPKTDRNSSFGAVKFVKKELVKKPEYGYVKDDTIFIKISVECDASVEA